MNWLVMPDSGDAGLDWCDPKLCIINYCPSKVYPCSTLYTPCSLYCATRAPDDPQW